jgi:hypothetical protein
MRDCLRPIHSRALREGGLSRSQGKGGRWGHGVGSWDPRHVGQRAVGGYRSARARGEGGATYYYLLHRDTDSLPNCSACPEDTFKPEMGGSAGALDCDECPAGKY